MAKLKGKYVYLGYSEADDAVLNTTDVHITSAQIVKRRTGNTVITMEEVDEEGDVWEWKLESSGGNRFKGQLDIKGGSDGWPCELQLWRSAGAGDRECMLLGFYRDDDSEIYNVAVQLWPIVQS